MTPAERDRIRRDVEGTRCPSCNALKVRVLTMPMPGRPGTVLCEQCGYNADLEAPRR